MTRASSAALAAIAALLWSSPSAAGVNKVASPPPIQTAIDVPNADGQAMAVSPDGRLLATLSAGLREVLVWDLASRRQVRVLAGHTDAIRCLAFSPDGQRLVSIATDKTIRVWSLLRGTEEARVEGTAWEFDVAWSPDGSKLAVGFESSTRFYDTGTWKVLAGIGEGGRGLAFSPDGKLLATGRWSKVLVEVATGKRLRELEGLSHSDTGHRGVAFSPDGKQVVFATAGHVAKVWDVQTGALVRTLTGHTDDLEAVAYSPDGRFIATGAFESDWKPGPGGKQERTHRKDAQGNFDRTVRLWNAETGAQEQAIHGGLHTSVAFAGRMLIDASLRLWSTETGAELDRLGGSERGTGTATASPDGKTLAVNQTDNSVMLWDLGSGRPLRRLTGHSYAIVTVAFSADGKLLATASRDNDARLWEVSSGKLLRTWAHPFMVERMALSSDGKLLACMVGHGTKNVMALELGPPPTLRKVGDPPPPPKPKLPPNHFVRLWETDTGKERATLIESEGDSSRTTFGRAVAFSPDGSLLATSYIGYPAVLWNTRSGARVREFAQGKKAPAIFEFSRDGKRLASADLDGGVALWDVASGKETLDLSVPGVASTFALSPDGKQIAVLSGDARVRIFRLGASAPERTLPGPPLGRLQYSADGRTFLLGGTFGSRIHFLDAATGTERVSLVAFGGLEFVLVRPDGYYMASRGAMRHVAFLDGLRAFSFENFDLVFNRPDLVLSRLPGADPRLVEAYHSAWLRRLRKMGMTEAQLGGQLHLPEVQLLTRALPLVTRDRTLKLTVRATDSAYRLDRLNVYVNDVPAFGVRGLPLREKQVSSVEQELSIELGAGRNKLQIAALNEKGVESLKETFEVRYEGPAEPPELRIVAVGISKYKDSQFDLTYAAKDAGDVVDFLTAAARKAGTKVRVLKLLDGDATREKILAARELLADSRVDDEAVVFVASHGLLDDSMDYFLGTTDVDFADPSKRGLGYDELEGLLDGIPARRKLLLMDACHSGGVEKEAVTVAASGEVSDPTVKVRGFKRLTNRSLELRDSFALAQELFADLRRGSGALVIASASGSEFAEESPEWKNGVFTFSMLEGLKSGAADLDKDGRVRVSELRDFVVERVQQLTKGRQTPTARRESFEFDFPFY